MLHVCIRAVLYSVHCYSSYLLLLLGWCGVYFSTGMFSAAFSPATWASLQLKFILALPKLDQSARLKLLPFVALTSSTVVCAVCGPQLTPGSSLQWVRGLQSFSTHSLQYWLCAVYVYNVVYNVAKKKVVIKFWYISNLSTSLVLSSPSLMMCLIFSRKLFQLLQHIVQADFQDSLYAWRLYFYLRNSNIGQCDGEL